MTHPLMVVTPMHSPPDERMTIPQKRKSRGDEEAKDSGHLSDEEEEDELQEDDHHPVPCTSTASPSTQAQPSGPDGETSSSGQPVLPEGENEYESGRVICEVCGLGVSIWDEETGGFSVTKWKEHRSSCATTSKSKIKDSAVSTSETIIVPPSLQQSISPRVPKKRRAKRSEEERIDFFRTDPQVAQFEAYRVLCGNCNKWIRLRSNSSYCSIPWEAHRGSCAAKKSSGGLGGYEQRRKVFSTDPNVREFEKDRVLCGACESWVDVGANDNRRAVTQWNKHKASCAKIGSGSAPPLELRRINGPTIDPVTPPPKEQLAFPSFSNISSVTEDRSPTPSTPPPDLSDIHKQSAEQRAAALHEDPLTGEIEPFRVRCTLCQKWVQLRKDITYCAYPWLQHRSKCVLRREKQRQEASETDDTATPPSSAAILDTPSVRSPVPEDGTLPNAKRIKLAHSSSRMGMDKDAGSTNDEANSVDLKSTSGRMTFIYQSVQYLFRTTYSRGDEITIGSLVTYLNSALPPDKFEDFDTIEVTRVAATSSLFHDGRFVFEGDAFRIAD